MRKTGIKLAGLAVALVGVAAAEKAEANDVTINGATTTPVVTSSPDGVSPGNVTLGTTGAITLGTNGQSAVTVDSNNSVTNNSGTDSGFRANDPTGIRAIRILGGFTGTITNAGTISFTETYTAADADSDGDLDGEWASGSDRIGILLEAGGHTGNIINSGPIGIEGDSSFGIRLNSLLTGNLTSTGNVTVIGDTGAAFWIGGGPGAGVNGDVVIGGAGVISVRGVGSRGLYIDAPISGELSLNGQWSVTGYHQTSRPFTAEALAKLDADDFLLSGSAIEVHRSIGGGITIEGIGVEDDTDDDGDGILESAESDDDVSANIQVYSNAPALLVSATPGENLVLGATSSGHGLNIRGSISSQGLWDNVESTAIRLQGSGTSSLTSAAGVLNDGVVFAGAFEADSFGLVIGQNATAPAIVNRKSITAATTAEGATDAYAILLESGATVNSLTNDGLIMSQAFGELAHARTITDRSNTLATINNTGTIRAQLVPTDTDATDDIVPVATGDRIAIDVSASTIGVTLNQTAQIPFTDQDAVDDDLANRPLVRIEGDVRFGSGSDTFNLLSGAMVGSVDFGAGATQNFTINGGAAFLGRIANSGNLNINVINGSLGVDGGTTNLTTAHFGPNATLSVLLSETPAQSTHLIASGTVTFDVGSIVVPIIPTGLPQSGSSIFLTANGGLIGGINVERIITGSSSPYLYDLEVSIANSDPNSLEASYVLKSTTALGLNPNEALAFSPILAALRQNSSASAAMALINNREAFESAYDDLLPTFTSGATELAATAIQQSQSATTNRLAATRLHDIDDVSVWVQEIGYGLTRTPTTDLGTEFRGYGFGLAGGIDGPLDNGGMFGLSASFITSQIEEPGRPDGELAASFGQANAYLGTAMGPIDIDLVAGGGVGRMSSLRGIEIGAFRAASEADWWAYEGHGAVRASLPLRLSDNFLITPHAALTYMALNETGYTEEGGGAAFDYDVESAFSQRLWADVGVELSARWRMGGEGMFAPRIMLGYRANVLDDEREREFQFASGGTPFTLTDEGTGSGAPLIGIGVDATNGFSTFSLSYEGEFGDQIDRHSLNAAIRFRF
jgi:uncharacterized protein with beta-barrel porin domain